MKEKKALEDIIAGYEALVTEFEDIEVLFELTYEEEEELEKELEKSIAKLGERIEDLKTDTLLDGEYDKNAAILSIHAGSGGSDAQDWAAMLLRMYMRFASDEGFRVEELDLITDDEAGIKSVTLRIEGLNAYGYLQSEKGVHRIVRISAFDSSGKRHTSFASVDVIPEIDDAVEVDINPADIKMDTYRASGAGGQHINKTSSAVRLTHIPTGVIVACQSQRSQHQNKDAALKMLYSKLMDLKTSEHKDKIEDLKGEYNQISWGSQIRSYVFHPYTLVKDHRTNVEVGNVQSVMDGNLRPFITAYLQQRKLDANEN